MAGGGEAPGRPNSGEDGSPPARERGGRAKGVCGLPWGGGLEARGGRWRAIHGGQCSPVASSGGWRGSGGERRGWLGLELQWKERKLDLGSNWAEGIRRGEVSVEVEWAVAMAGGGRVGLVCAQEELGSAFYRQGRRGQAN